VCSAIVLDLVASDAVAAGWNFLQRIFVASYATGTLLGDADPQCAATFRVLALGLLGMDGCGRSVPIPLRGGFPNAAASNFDVCQSGRLRCDSRWRLNWQCGRDA